MRIVSAEFCISAVTKTQFPRDGLPEIVLIGRSNVGKSSLINTFTNRKKLAKTSSTPGKTQTINFYKINRSFYLVDLPGFGYAKVPMAVKRSWEKMLTEYVTGRDTLKGALVILDPRRDPGDMEEYVFDWLTELGLPAVTVVTKADKLSRNKLSSRVAALRRGLGIEPPVVFSSLKGAGKADLATAIQTLLQAGE